MPSGNEIEEERTGKESSGRVFHPVKVKLFHPSRRNFFFRPQRHFPLNYAARLYEAVNRHNCSWSAVTYFSRRRDRTRRRLKWPFVDPSREPFNIFGYRGKVDLEKVGFGKSFEPIDHSGMRKGEMWIGRLPISNCANEEKTAKFPVSSKTCSLSAQSKVDWDKVLLAFCSQKMGKQRLMGWLCKVKSCLCHE